MNAREKEKESTCQENRKIKSILRRVRESMDFNLSRNTIKRNWDNKK